MHIDRVDGRLGLLLACGTGQSGRLPLPSLPWALSGNAAGHRGKSLTCRVLDPVWLGDFHRGQPVGRVGREVKSDAVGGGRFS